jgi:diguanylate cyclase (GGDEF)-like protein
MIRTGELGDILEQLCPMFVLLDGTGHILRVGPTLQKLRPDQPMPGQRFLELFELNRPRMVSSFDELLGATGAKLHLQFRDTPRTSLKGSIVPLPRAEGANGAERPETCGAIVNLSFGISVLDAVRDYALNSADFAATDLTIELLYLVEAKSAAMEASRTLNLRLQGAMIAAEEQAFTDTLTGLKNRRAMDHVLERMIGAGTGFALMNLDLDYFKSVNDTLGHAAGDHVLQQAARIMVEESREQDIVARVGGDEFVLIFDRLRDKTKLRRIATRLIKRLEEPIVFGDQTCRISASVGTVIRAAASRPEAAQLLHEADLALYAAKHAGRACHRFFQPDMLEAETNTGVAVAEAGKTPATVANAK